MSSRTAKTEKHCLKIKERKNTAEDLSSISCIHVRQLSVTLLLWDLMPLASASTWVHVHMPELPTPDTQFHVCLGLTHKAFLKIKRKKKKKGQVLWHTPLITAFQKQRQAWISVYVVTWDMQRKLKTKWKYKAAQVTSTVSSDSPPAHLFLLWAARATGQCSADQWQTTVPVLFAFQWLSSSWPGDLACPASK